MYLRKVISQIPLKKKKKKFVDVWSLTKIAGSGSISQKYGSADPIRTKLSLICNTVENYLIVDRGDLARWGGGPSGHSRSSRVILLLLLCPPLPSQGLSRFFPNTFRI
jgi:hypothetical protein